MDQPGPLPSILKDLFGLKDLEDEDFADVIQSPLGKLARKKAWISILIQQAIGKLRIGIQKVDQFISILSYLSDETLVGSNEFYNFCDTLTAGGGSSKIGLIRM